MQATVDSGNQSSFFVYLFLFLKTHPVIPLVSKLKKIIMVTQFQERYKSQNKNRHLVGRERQKHDGHNEGKRLNLSERG